MNRVDGMEALDAVENGMIKLGQNRDIWQHMDNAKSKTMYCACFQETGHSRICGVERTYQRHRALSPLSLDAARAAELGVSYGQYKARGGI